ncbi:hypothetical protein [Streptomyces tubercidicus]
MPSQDTPGISDNAETNEAFASAVHLAGLTLRGPHALFGAALPSVYVAF